MPKPAVVWLRDDLRLTDNPALDAAIASGHPVLPLYVLDTSGAGRPIGAAARWWLHQSLAALALELGRRGATVLLRRGDPQQILPELGAAAVFWNRSGEPPVAARDRLLEQRLAAAGVRVATFEAALLCEPDRIKRYSVFTPFWRACRAMGDPPAPSPAPKHIDGAEVPPGDRLDDWCLRPTAPDWAGGLRETWRPGEAGAQERLDTFLDRIAGYAGHRDRPSVAGSSMLSPHLRWGEVGPRQVWHAVRARAAADGLDGESFLKELYWREFSYHLLFHAPDLATKPIRAGFERFPWRSDAASLAEWKRGLTGYPMVDAGMRQLWEIGWMHNRARMIAASFLVKHLLLPWQQGEAWFWDTLVDADPANNPASWQWVAGSGADAAPFFRIFNPVLQGERFDPDGAYVRRFVPELARLPSKFIHKPWQAPPAILAAAGVKLGGNYPSPIVDHAFARRRALLALSGAQQ